MARVLTEEEIAARNALIARMQKEQEMRDKVAPQQQDNVERCPHGVPLRKSCPKCDVVTEDQIQDRIPVQM